MIPVPQSVREELAQSHGTDACSLTQFGGGREESDGVVYAYPFGNGRRLLKILAVPVEDQHKGLFCLEERLQFARFLGTHGARIAYPRLSPQGNLYETHLSGAHLWVGYSMDIAPGRLKRPDEWDTTFFCNWGQTIGTLHRLARQYPTWKASIDPATGDELLTWEEEWAAFYDWCQDDDVRHKWSEIRTSLEALPVTRDAFGFVHNDPHLWNLMVDGENITLLDFDVANHHWFISDVAIAAQSILFALTGGMDRPLYHRPKLVAFLDHFLKGYEREHHLSQEWLGHLDLFIAYRRILMYTVMYEGIQSKPAYAASWKRMILIAPDVVGAYSVASGRW